MCNAHSVWQAQKGGAAQDVVCYEVLCNARCMSIQPEHGIVPEFDLADRMRKALRVSGVGVQEIADYLEVSRGAVGNWINGKARPNPAAIKLWALRTGVPYAWLRSGEMPRGPEGCPEQDSNLQPTVLRFRLHPVALAGARAS